jgi:hypothetical protein
MNLEQVVAYVSSADAEDVVAVLKAISVWPAIRDAWGVGGQALSLELALQRQPNAALYRS